MTNIEVTLTFDTPLHISSGASLGTFADRGLLKGKDGWPYVPASTFKGRLRHAVEQVATALSIKPTTCVTHQQMCGKCMVCQLFGAPWQKGRLRFKNFTLQETAEIKQLKNQIARQRPLRPTYRTGIALNRKRGVAQDNFLYRLEVFLPGIELVLVGTIFGDEQLTPEEAGLLVAGLNLLPAIGLRKTGGVGWLKANSKVTNEVWSLKQLEDALHQCKTISSSEVT